LEFFGFSVFNSLEGGMLVAVAAVIFIVGLMLTIKGGDWFVDSASWFAAYQPEAPASLFEEK